MRYQLVFQFQTTHINGYDDLNALENALIESPLRTFEVDGHDAGSGEFNIFLFTDDPEIVFTHVENIITHKLPSQSFKAAYRAVGSDNYVLIWPPGLHDFKIA